MSKLEKFIETVNPVVSKISNSVFVKALMGGMMAAFPVIMIGSIASILMSLQIPTYQNFLETSNIKIILNLMIVCTTNLVALYTTFGLAYSYAKHKEQDSLAAGIIGLASFLVITPFTSTVTERGTAYALPTQWLGGQGLFCALIIGYLVSVMFVFIKKRGWTIKLPESVPPVVSNSFAGIIPGLLITLLFAVIAVIFTHTSYGSVHQAVYSLLQIPLQGLGTNIWAVIIATIIAQSLWMLGIHGGMVVIPVVGITWHAADLANLAAFNAGDPLPNIVGVAFYQLCTFAGGGLGLAICMLFAKSKRYKTLGRVALLPSAFQISEPLIFGTPIVMNFKMFIPQVFTPVVSILVGYVLTVFGVIPRMSGATVPSGTPIVLRGLLQGSWKLAVFHALLVLVWIACYYPFFKRIDKDALKEEQQEEFDLQEAVALQL